MDSNKEPGARQEAGKWCGVVVTYFPPAGLHERLAKIRDLVDQLVVIDNSADEAVADELRRATTSLQVSIIANEHNLGIATALNQGVERALAAGAEWVVFFDQDSEPEDCLRRELTRVISSYAGPRPIGIIGCNYLSGSPGRARFTQEGQTSAYVETQAVITSGSAYSAKMLSRLGPFKDEYFIDFVDIEYCWRADREGYSVLRTSAPLLTHAIGVPVQHKLLWWTFDTTNHQPFRRYYAARNVMSMALEYFRFAPLRVMNVAVSQIKVIILILLFETGKRVKLGHYWRGLVDGVRKRGGARELASH
jgi:rhamnosyltransferase